jgi:enoyl-CoA hydratase/carnithine racemase
MTTHDSLLSQVEAGVAWITLNRTAQRNALDIPTLKTFTPCSTPTTLIQRYAWWY